MKNTGNYKLKKPEGTDTVNIEDLNYNADIIDNELVKRALKTDMPTNLNQFTNGPGFITATGAPVQSVNGKTGTLILSASDVGAETPIGSQAKVNTLAGQVGNINDANLPVELKGKPLTEQTKVVFQNADNGKKNWVDVIGNPLLNTDTFSQLKDKTQVIKNTLASNLAAKGQNSTGTETLTNLANKVGSIAKGQGNAVESQVLSGVTFTNADGVLRTGNIPNRSFSATGNNYTFAKRVRVDNIGNLCVVPPTGYYLEEVNNIDFGPIVFKEPNLLPENIVIGKSILGVVGTAQTGGIGITSIVGSSHSKENAACDIPQIRLEFYNRIFPNNIWSMYIFKNDVPKNIWGGQCEIKTVATGNASDEESMYLNLNESFYPNTKYTVVLPEGTLKDKLGNALKAMQYEFRTSANPSAWVSNPAGLNIGRYDIAGFGTQDAAVSYAGYPEKYSSSVHNSPCESFNGTSWNQLTAYIWNFGNSGGCGTQNAGLSTGGYNYYNSGKNYVTGKFDGNVWSQSNSMSMQRDYPGNAGNQNAALVFGGYNNNTTESFNGSAWILINKMTVTRCRPGGCGTQNAALAVSDDWSNDITCEKFNGTTWSKANNTINISSGCVANGTQDASIAFVNAISEKFNGNTWSTTSNPIISRHQHAGCGAQNSALSFGGSNTSYTNNCSTVTEKFFG